MLVLIQWTSAKESRDGREDLQVLIGFSDREYSLFDCPSYKQINPLSSLRSCVLAFFHSSISPFLLSSGPPVLLFFPSS